MCKNNLKICCCVSVSIETHFSVFFSQHNNQQWTNLWNRKVPTAPCFPLPDPLPQFTLNKGNCNCFSLKNISIISVFLRFCSPFSFIRAIHFYGRPINFMWLKTFRTTNQRSVTHILVAQLLGNNKFGGPLNLMA